MNQSRKKVDKKDDHTSNTGISSMVPSLRTTVYFLTAAAFLKMKLKALEIMLIYCNLTSTELTVIMKI
jgi:hypothetical protein